MKILPIIACLAGLVACGDLSRRTAPESAPSLTFAFYNVENLFDPADDPAIVGDDEFTPRGANHWSELRLERKLEGIARALRAINGYRGADVIGLCEVENRRVLQLLIDEFLPRGYALVHAESPDERGIDVALLYRTGAVRLVGFHPHRVDLGEGERPTRDILEATFEREGKRFTVLANHWPSKRGGGEESSSRRSAAARVAAAVVDSLTARDSAADILLVGDFNDAPFSAAISGDLDARPLLPGHPFHSRLINTAAPVAMADTIGSYYFRGKWEMIDQIMLSRGALDSSGLVLRERSESVFAPDFLRDERGRDHPPFHTYRGSLYLGGTSDHFPVYLVVGWR